MLQSRNKISRVLTWLVTLFVTALILLHIDADIVERLVILRVPLLSGLLLLTLPFIAFYLLPNILENLFVLENRLRLTVVIVVSTLAGLGVVFIWFVIDINAGCRFIGENCQNITTRLNPNTLRPYLAGVIIGLPISFASVHLSNIPKREKVIGSVMGGLIALAFMFFIYSLRQDNGNSALIFLENTFIMGIKLVLSEAAQVGFINSTGGLSGGHLLVLSFALVTFVFYVVGYFLYEPSVEKGKFFKGKWQAPALYHLMVLVLAITFLLGLMTFVFDYFRVPTLLIAVIISWSAYAFFKTDHFFKLIPLPSEKPDSHVKDALKNRLAINNDGTLVVVCSSGGGIQAAGWTTMVLTQLQRQLGQSFSNAIGLISSVSGGSVGAMHYLDISSETDKLDDKQLDLIFQNSTKNSLDAMAWGLAYPDLWRLMGAPYLPSKLNDRGTAIETDWKKVMKYPQATLADWQASMQAGNLPITVFNSTQVETGRRLLLCPLSFSKCNNHHQVDFNSLYKKYDLEVTTAARLSATFAYISPIARDSEDIHSSHVADGGYFDNYGVFTANQWLDREVLPIAKDIGIKRIMFIEIKAFPATPNMEVKKKKADGWVMSFLGPLLTLANVRNATQDARNEYDVDVMAECQSHDIDFKHYILEFPNQIAFYETNLVEQDQSQSNDASQTKKILKKVAILFSSKKNYMPPISWKLSEKQKQAISQGWDAISTEEVPPHDLQKLIETWQRWHA